MINTSFCICPNQHKDSLGHISGAAWQKTHVMQLLRPQERSGSTVLLHLLPCILHLLLFTLHLLPFHAAPTALLTAPMAPLTAPVALHITLHAAPTVLSTACAALILHLLPLMLHLLPLVLHLLPFMLHLLPFIMQLLPFMLHPLPVLMHLLPFKLPRAQLLICAMFTLHIADRRCSWHERRRPRMWLCIQSLSPFVETPCECEKPLPNHVAWPWQPSEIGQLYSEVP